MKRFLILVLCLCSFFMAAIIANASNPFFEKFIPVADRLSPPTPKYTPPKGHPRVMFTESDIPRIRKGIEDPFNNTFYKLLLKNAAYEKDGTVPPVNNPKIANLNNDILQAIDANAFLYAVFGDAKAGQRALELMKNYSSTMMVPNFDIGGITYATICDTGETLFVFGCAYDWCYDLLSESDKDYYINVMISLAGKLECGFPPTRLTSLTGHMGESMIFKDSLAAGIAIYDERPEIYNWAASRIINEMAPFRNFLYKSGMHNEGDQYGPYRFHFEAYSAWLFKTIGVNDIFSEDMGLVPFWTIYTKRPDGFHMQSGDAATNMVYPRYSGNNSMHYTLAGNLYPNPYFAYEANKGLSVSNYHGIKPSAVLIINNPDIGRKPLNDLPLSRFFPDPMGEMVSRTGWKFGVDSPVALAYYKIGGLMINNHQHLDAGQFSLYYKGPLIIDSGIYQGKSGGYGSAVHINYNKRSAAHNVVTVKDPNEAFFHFGTQVVNDGGQRSVNQMYIPNHAFELNSDEFIRARVLAEDMGVDPITPDYTYMKGDLKKAYSDKIDSYERAFTFLNFDDEEYPAAFVVMDRVNSKNATFPKSWLLHTISEPVIEGANQTIVNTNYGYNGRAVNTTLLPKQDNFQIEKTGGAGQEFTVDGNNFPQAPNSDSIYSKYEHVGSWRLAISPKTSDKEDIFLNVMQMSDAEGGPEPLKAELIEGDNAVGAQIRDRAVIFKRDNANNVFEPVFTISAEDTLKCLVTDLKAGYYTVLKDGKDTGFDYYVQEQTGTIYLDVTSGDYSFKYTKEKKHEEVYQPQNKISPKKEIPDDIFMFVARSVMSYTEQPPYSEKDDKGNEYIMVPFEGLARFFEYDLEYKDNALTMKSDVNVIKLTIGGDIADVNGITVPMPLKIANIDGTLFMPVDSLWEVLRLPYYVEQNGKIINVTRGIDISNGRKIPPRMKIPIFSKQYIHIKNFFASGDDGWNVYYSLCDLFQSSTWITNRLNEYAVFEFDKSEPVSRVRLYFPRDSVEYHFDIEASEDGESWTTAVKDGSARLTEQYYTDVRLDGVNAKYIKVVAKGSTLSAGENSETFKLSEVVFPR